MNALLQLVVDRVPLAKGFLQVLQQGLALDQLPALFEQHRGTGSEQQVTMAWLVEWVSNALLRHHGSGRQALHEMAGPDDVPGLPACQSAIYGKLRRCPAQLSQAWVAASAARLRCLQPRTTTTTLPPCFQGLRVLIVDGKKLKNLPKRCAALRGQSGKLLGGKVVAGLCLNDGLVTHLEATLDGEANDAPLTPGLVNQCCQTFVKEQLLFVADRQFCDLKIPHLILQQQAAFVVRRNKKTSFTAENTQLVTDTPTRQVTDSSGWLGSAKDPRRLRVRQISLQQPEQEEVVLITSLMSAEQYPAEEILQLYRARWQIEQVFQQLVEVFELEAYIGTSPQGAVFQFAMCTVLYNVLHVLRTLIAQEQKLLPRQISTKLLWTTLQQQLSALAVVVPTQQWSLLVPSAPVAQLCETLGPLLIHSLRCRRFYGQASLLYWAYL